MTLILLIQTNNCFDNFLGKLFYNFTTFNFVHDFLKKKKKKNRTQMIIIIIIIILGKNSNYDETSIEL